jgi:hypothetical protein
VKRNTFLIQQRCASRFKSQYIIKHVHDPTKHPMRLQRKFIYVLHISRGDLKSCPSCLESDVPASLTRELQLSFTVNSLSDHARVRRMILLRFFGVQFRMHKSNHTSLFGRSSVQRGQIIHHDRSIATVAVRAALAQL